MNATCVDRVILPTHLSNQWRTASKTNNLSVEQTAPRSESGSQADLSSFPSIHYLAFFVFLTLRLAPTNPALLLPSPASKALQPSMRCLYKCYLMDRWPFRGSLPGKHCGWKPGMYLWWPMCPQSPPPLTSPPHPVVTLGGACRKTFSF